MDNLSVVLFCTYGLFILYLWLILAFSNTFKLLNVLPSFQKAPCVIFTYPNAFFQNAFILKS